MPCTCLWMYIWRLWFFFRFVLFSLLSSARSFFSHFARCCHTKVRSIHSMRIMFSGWRYGLSISFSFFRALEGKKSRNDFYCRTHALNRYVAVYNICSFEPPTQSILKWLFFFVTSTRRTHTRAAFVWPHIQLPFFFSIEMKSNFNMDFRPKIEYPTYIAFVRVSFRVFFSLLFSFNLLCKLNYSLK